MSKSFKDHVIMPFVQAVVGIVGICLPMISCAVDAVWDSTKASGSKWITASNWKDATTGSVLGTAPTTASDTAFIASPTGAEYVVEFDSVNGGNGTMEIAVGKVYSDWMPTLMFGTAANSWTAFYKQTFSVDDPDDFKGFYTTWEGRGCLKLNATPSHVPVASHVDTYGYNWITVPDAGTKAQVRTLFGNGAIRKDGSGDLEVMQGGGWDSRIYVDDGALVLNGSPADHAEPYVPYGAWVHLDASDADSLETYEETYGNNQKRLCVAKWKDCDGGSVYAMTNGFHSGATHYMPYSRAPYISSVQSGTGRNLVDFGSQCQEATDESPANCWMKLSSNCSSVREVFYAAWCTVSSTNAYKHQVTLLGSSDLGDNRDLAGGGRVRIFDTYPGSAPAQHGTLTFNGQRVLNQKIWGSRYGSDPSSLHVVGAAFDQNLMFNALSCERNIMYYTGGWRLGELIVYTRELSDDERRAVVRYLMQKWVKDYRPDDVGEVVLHADTASVNVPEGRVAHIKSLSAQGAAKITKTGGGTLIVDAISPTDAPIDIQGGSVRVTTPSVSTSAPAANPMVWLDATVPSSFVFSNDVNGVATPYIMRWNDRRSEVTTHFAEVPAPDAGTSYWTSNNSKNHLPKTMASASPTGCAAVDFGACDNGAWMWIQPRDKVDSYAGFVAIRVKNAATYRFQYFGTSNTDLLSPGWYTKMMIQQNYTTVKGVSLGWAIDGRFVDPWFSHQDTYNSTQWRVVSFSGSRAKVRADLLAKYSATGADFLGNVEIGELILFDRPLSWDERRNTEAYLMQKWLGKPHPESAEGVEAHDYTFGGNVDEVVDTGASDMVVTNLSGGTGSLIKYGAGTLTLTDMTALTNGMSFVAEEGTLELPLDIPDDAFIRLDASDLASFTRTYTTDDGAGGLVTNITRWADQVSGREAFSVTENGLSSSFAGASGSCCTNPTLVYAEMPDGSMKPAVDFGGYLNVATLWTGSPRHITPENMNGSAGMKLPGFETSGACGVNEAHVVVADWDGDRGVFFGQWLNQDYDYYTRRAGYMFRSPYHKYGGAICYGNVYLDGSKLTVMPHEQPFSRYTFHLVSIQPTNTLDVGALSMERNCNSGGNRICEYVGYKKAHSREVFEFIQKKLMAKWFGSARPNWFRNFTTLRAAEGATIDINTPAAVTAGELSGGGTIAAPEVRGVSSITVDRAGKPIVVSGKVTLAASGVVHVLDMSAASEPGDYTLFSADEIAFADDGNIAEWLFDAAPVRRSHVVTLVKDGQLLKLRVHPRSTVMVLR